MALDRGPWLWACPMPLTARVLAGALLPADEKVIGCLPAARELGGGCGVDRACEIRPGVVGALE